MPWALAILLAVTLSMGLLEHDGRSIPISTA
jgi:hypothetical protein